MTAAHDLPRRWSRAAAGDTCEATARFMVNADRWPHAHGAGCGPISTTRNLVYRFAASRVLRAVLPADAMGKKRLYPIAPGADLSALMAGHLAGRLPPVLCRTQDGTTWIEHRAVALAACPIADGTATWCALDVDAAGHGHHTTATAADADRGAQVAGDLLDHAGMSYVVAASGGGTGRHVWVSETMPAGMSAWFAGLVKGQVLAVVPGADIEIRPGSDRAPGAPMTLPRGGAYAAQGGGHILREASGRAGAIDTFRVQWERIAANWASERAARQVEREARLSEHGGGDIQSADVSLLAVVKILADITEQHGNELRVRCPRHLGHRALTVNLARRVWKCFACDTGGAGDAAAFTLTRFLLGDPPAREVFAALRGIAGHV